MHSFAFKIFAFFENFYNIFYPHTSCNNDNLSKYNNISRVADLSVESNCIMVMC